MRTDRPAELLDVYPTLLELADLKFDPEQQGQSLVPLLNNPTQKWEHPAITSFGPGNFSIRTTRYRYIQYRDGSQELYDHQTDPDEWNNLVTNPDLHSIVKTLSDHIPRQPHALLPGDSTGHKAFHAANKGAGIP